MTDTIRTKCCGTCRWWHAGPGTLCRCHRHAPTLEEDRPAGFAAAEWPITYPADFCGGWQPSEGTADWKNYTTNDPLEAALKWLTLGITGDEDPHEAMREARRAIRSVMAPDPDAPPPAWSAPIMPGQRGFRRYHSPYAPEE